MSWVDSIKERSEISIIELIGISWFCLVIAITNHLVISMYSMFVVIGLLILTGHIFKFRHIFEKRIKFI
jgi:hypothetical protein